VPASPAIPGETGKLVRLAFAHVTAKAQGLAKREPALAGEPSLDDGTPKNEDISPLPPYSGHFLR
jgi:hypothetical protein